MSISADMAAQIAQFTTLDSNASTRNAALLAELELIRAAITASTVSLEDVQGLLNSLLTVEKDGVTYRLADVMLALANQTAIPPAP